MFFFSRSPCLFFSFMMIIILHIMPFFLVTTIFLFNGDTYITFCTINGMGLTLCVPSMGWG